MHQIFSGKNESTEEITCARCHWEGKLDKAVQEHLFLTDAIEIYCPQCEGYIGFISQEEEN
jgi:hypothetical protein